ncbi:phycoerythrin alpha subunit 14 [Guillardia theta CCMP2712]|uniref:Phycoerythrin alpha subunit 14 n=3 Tax=Guillardia theta TaxID=55529 RepID=L1J381_GUITC|nr:phycoerythrin alpha subunit 14 [Guillardia theta CCMP2712]EKX42966.1 phycoerythrin alpha subunit 14 [Guillardia theta CCMP2712]CAH04979.1 phycoerythrin alpha-subunit 3 precursor [Guillardia theta]|eukprot:XP_005829946.1 phycoerythrin alpha subunit 14 [Guillardia theta CCMP2712]
MFMAKTLAAVAVLAGSASAFAPTAMPLRAQRSGASAMNMQAEQVSRRSVLEGAALAALAAPMAANAIGEGPSNTFSGQNGIATKTANGLLGTSIVGVGKNGAPKGKNFAPMITIFDARGCDRGGVEYKGPKAGTTDDEMLVKVELIGIKVPEYQAAAFTREQLGYTYPTTRYPKSTSGN